MTPEVIDARRAAANHCGMFNRKELSMSTLASPRFLRNVLLADAASCAATGALQVLFSQSLTTLLQLPAPLLVGTGWFLLAYAAVVGIIATREPLPRALVGILVAGNLGWAVACCALLAS